MSEDLNKLRERLDLYAKDSARPLPSWACQAMKEASAALARLQAAEERAAKVEGVLKTVRQVLIDHGSGTCGPHCEAMYGEDTYFKDEIVLLNAALKTKEA